MLGDWDCGRPFSGFHKIHRVSSDLGINTKNKDRKFNAALQRILLRRTGRSTVGWSVRGREEFTWVGPGRVAGGRGGRIGEDSGARTRVHPRTQKLSSARQEDQHLPLATRREIADEAFGQGPVGPQKSQAAEAAAELPEKQAQELHFELA